MWLYVETADSPTENFISVELFNLLGPSGLNVLLDRTDDGDSVVTVEDVVLVTNVGDAGVDAVGHTRKTPKHGLRVIRGSWLAERQLVDLDHRVGSEHR